MLRCTLHHTLHYILHYTLHDRVHHIVAPYLSGFGALPVLTVAASINIRLQPSATYGCSLD